jgi:hypothetical protein
MKNLNESRVFFPSGWDAVDYWIQAIKYWRAELMKDQPPCLRPKIIEALEESYGYLDSVLCGPNKQA